MSTLTIQLPDSLKRQVERLALHDGISVEQFVTLAAAEKVSALETESQLAKRAARANRDAFLDVMAKVPDAEPEPWDRLK
jgi:predicted transcriptional regulator